MTWLEPSHLLATFGIVGVFVIMFAETGLLVGFFLPGDSLLFTAGLFAATEASSPTHLPLVPLLVAAAAGALIGAQVGYVIGRQAGPRLLERPEFPRRYAGVQKAREVLDRYGHRKAIVLARFIPIVRTIMNPMAGTVQVPAASFALWQVLGGLVWTIGLILAGHALGSRIPDIDRYLLPIIAVIVLVSVVPVALSFLRRARTPQQSPVEAPPA